jgi:hypothetical protein
MCKLYSITTNQEAIRALFRVINRYVGGDSGQAREAARINRQPLA